MKTIKPEWQTEADAFRRDYADRGCTCFLSPPCDFCLHPGNPANLAETEEAWEESLGDADYVIDSLGELLDVLGGPCDGMQSLVKRIDGKLPALYEFQVGQYRYLYKTCVVRHPSLPNFHILVYKDLVKDNAKFNALFNERYKGKI